MIGLRIRRHRGLNGSELIVFERRKLVIAVGRTWSELLYRYLLALGYRLLQRVEPTRSFDASIRLEVPSDVRRRRVAGQR